MSPFIRALALAAILVMPVAESASGNTGIVAPSGRIAAGESATYANGQFYVVRDVVVEAGGSLTFDHADVVFVGGPWVITVEPGATFASMAGTRMRPDPTGDAAALVPEVPHREGRTIREWLFEPRQGSGTLLEAATQRSFRVDVLPGAIFELASTTVEDGVGVDVFSALTTVEDVRFLRNEVGLTLHDVDVELHDLNFTENLVGLRVMGGSVDVRDSYFDRNNEHIVANDSDLTLEGNEIYAGLHGVVMDRGNADFTFNTMQEHLGPDTIGAWLRQTTTARLDHNTIEDWAQNVVIDGASATELTWNTIGTSQPDEAYSLVSVYGGLDEVEEQHVADHNTFTRGSVNYYADWTPGSYQIDHNTLFDADLAASWAPGFIEDNTGERSFLWANGPITIQRNTLDGLGIEGAISGFDGATVQDNAVSNSPWCFWMRSSASIGNTATECGMGFYLEGAGDISSTGDEYHRAATDPDAGAAFYVRGRDGTITDAFVEHASTGIHVTPMDALDGGWVVSGTTVRDSENGMLVHVDVWDVTITDSRFLSNVRGIVTEARDTYIDDTWIRDNALEGVSVTGGTALGSGNWIQGNGYGVVLGSAGHATLPGNYWGHALGPTDSTHPGQGDSVDDAVAWAPPLASPP